MNEGEILLSKIVCIIYIIIMMLMINYDHLN